MFPEIDTRNSGAVRAEVAAIYESLFPGSNPALLNEAFQWVEDCFAGRYADYQPIDTQYHDFQHTLQVTLCYVRLLEGYKRSGARPELTRRMFELALLAILLHDTGYLKKRGDEAGTGAKYTLVHVARSAEFAATLLAGKGFPPREILSVQNMIRCTGVNADFRAIPFHDELEKNLGFGLATADLLGQMAAPDYIDKLAVLYQEFDESNRFNGTPAGPGVFSSARDLRLHTPVFWEGYVLPRINHDFRSMHQYLARPLPSGPNAYLTRVEQNIARLKARLRLEPAPAEA